MPSTVVFRSKLAVLAIAALGKIRKTAKAAGMIVTTSNIAYSCIVRRQPYHSIAYAKSGAQITPARACPLAISANAVPRRRSNQRDTYT